MGPACPAPAPEERRRQMTTNGIETGAPETKALSMVDLERYPIFDNHRRQAVIAAARQSETVRLCNPAGVSDGIGRRSDGQRDDRIASPGTSQGRNARCLCPTGRRLDGPAASRAPNVSISLGGDRDGPSRSVWSNTVCLRVGPAHRVSGRDP